METNDVGAIQVPRGEGRMLWLMGDLIELKMVGEDTGGSYALIESNPPPGFLDRRRTSTMARMRPSTYSKVRSS